MTHQTPLGTTLAHDRLTGPPRGGLVGSLSALRRRLTRLLAAADDASAPSVPGAIRAHRFGHGHGHGDRDADGNAITVDDDDVLAAYRRQATELHERLVHDRGLSVVEFVGATGSGKTRLLERLVDRAPDGERIGVVVGDVAGEDDAERLREHGVEVTTVNTGKECHLDPELLDSAVEAFDLDALDRLYVENVGNMVCPADFPLGAQVRVLVVSTTEGDDVVRKHPLLFQACDAAVVNKADVAEAVDADVFRMVGDVDDVAPDLSVFVTSAKTGRGIDDLAYFLDERVRRGHDHDHAHSEVADDD